MPESVSSYEQGLLSESQMKTARERAKHVVVLMLENRSFDHMLGFLDHPNPDEFDGLAGTTPKALPVDLDDPSAGTVLPTDTAHPQLGVDPPHGHVSAMMQIDLKGRNFRMDGFPTAYGRKLSGKESVPVVRWGRVLLVSPVLALILAAATYDLARLGILGGWRHFVPWIACALLVSLLAQGAYQLTRAPGISSQLRVLIVVLPAVIGALATQGVWHWVNRASGRIAWPVVSWGVVMAAIGTARGRLKQRARVPARQVREESKNIMRCMAPSRVPVLAKLAREYAVCTRWYSSVPGGTWPNRNFAHAGTSDESTDIEIGFYEDDTVFDRLDEAHRPPDGPQLDPTWRIYFDQLPQVAAFPRLWAGSRVKNWLPMAQLLADIESWTPENRTLAMYSFVEPCHSGPTSNSQHPGNNEEYGSEDFQRGEALIAAIYDKLVGNEALFKEAVLLVTYDEHGGFYDRVAPPRARPPDPLRGRHRSVTRNLVGWFVDYRSGSFAFSYLGVRVPTVIVSPWVRPSKVDRTTYDHSSIAATVRRLFAPGTAPLSVREEHANDFLHLLLEGTGTHNTGPTVAGMVATTAFPEAAEEPARRVSTEAARNDDSLEHQLAALEGAVHECLAPILSPPAAREAGGDSLQRTPAVSLLRTAGDRARRGEPLPNDFLRH